MELRGFEFFRGWRIVRRRRRIGKLVKEEKIFDLWMANNKSKIIVERCVVLGVAM